MKSMTFSISQTQINKAIKLSGDTYSHLFDYKTDSDVFHDFISTLDKFLDKRLREIQKFQSPKVL